MYKKAPKVKRNKRGKYHMRPQDMVNSAKNLETIIYRMGEYGLFQVIGEYEEYYTGNWYHGNYNKLVLKKDLRKLTDDEFDNWYSKYEIICGIKVPLNITKD